tara:strand:- start:725 stop:1132 length:408 start_codon:yes stop_codon:yes gene_type:complete
MSNNNEVELCECCSHPLKTYVFEKEVLMMRTITVKADHYESAYELVNNPNEYSELLSRKPHLHRVTSLKPVLNPYNSRPTESIECITKLTEEDHVDPLKDDEEEDYDRDDLAEHEYHSDTSDISGYSEHMSELEH